MRYGNSMLVGSGLVCPDCGTKIGPFRTTAALDLAVRGHNANRHPEKFVPASNGWGVTACLVAT